MNPTPPQPEPQARVVSIDAGGGGMGASSQLLPLDPALLQPAAYFCHHCDREHSHAPLDTHGPVNEPGSSSHGGVGPLIRRQCVHCASDLVEVIESDAQREEAISFAATQRRRARMAQQRLQQQSVVMQVGSVGHDGQMRTQTLRMQIPVGASSATLEPAAAPQMQHHPQGPVPFVSGATAFPLQQALRPMFGDGLQHILDQLFDSAQEGYTQRGSSTPAAVVDALPRFTASIASAPLEPCSVCLEPPSGSDVCLKLPCGHVYHEACILPWLEAHSTCPSCRASVVREPTSSEDSNDPPAPS